MADALYRMFDGKKYRYYAWMDTKQEAKKVAKHTRKQGYLVKVVEGRLLYVRKK